VRILHQRNFSGDTTTGGNQNDFTCPGNFREQGPGLLVQFDRTFSPCGSRRTDKLHVEKECLHDIGVQGEILLKHDKRRDLRVDGIFEKFGDERSGTFKGDRLTVGLFRCHK
jgi:hypothetical protein